MSEGAADPAAAAALFGKHHAAEETAAKPPPEWGKFSRLVVCRLVAGGVELSTIYATTDRLSLNNLQHFLLLIKTLKCTLWLQQIA